MTIRPSLRMAAILGIASLAAGCAAAARTPRPIDPYAELGGLTAARKAVVLEFTGEPLARVFAAIGQSYGIAITVDAKGDRKINVRTEKASLKEALVQIAEEQGLVYEITGPDRMTVRDRVPRPR